MDPVYHGIVLTNKITMCLVKRIGIQFPVGGFDTFENLNISQNGSSSPGRGRNQKYVKPPPSFLIMKTDIQTHGRSNNLTQTLSASAFLPIAQDRMEFASLGEKLTLSVLLERLGNGDVFKF